MYTHIYTYVHMQIFDENGKPVEGAEVYGSFKTPVFTWVFCNQSHTHTHTHTYILTRPYTHAVTTTLSSPRRLPTARNAYGKSNPSPNCNCLINTNSYNDLNLKHMQRSGSLMEWRQAMISVYSAYWRMDTFGMRQWMSWIDVHRFKHRRRVKNCLNSHCFT